jgi:5-methylcytosine-specific restriction endonuclease McrA
VWPSEKEARAAAQDRRRAKKFGAGYERFWRKSIFERDGWVCQICHLPVDRSESPDKHLRPSLDHKVPLAKDGAHSRENVQCAHWICNSRKAHSLDGGMKAAALMKAEYATRWSAARCGPQAQS